MSIFVLFTLSACVSESSPSSVLVNHDSLMIEFDANTNAKTVSAKANCEPDFRSKVTAGAGAKKTTKNNQT